MSLKDKLSKVNPQINIERAENGWIFEASGRSHDDDWKNIKIIMRWISSGREMECLGWSATTMHACLSGSHGS